MFTVAISGFDNYLNFSICTMYIALLMINKSLYVILDAYKKTGTPRPNFPITPAVS